MRAFEDHEAYLLHEIGFRVTLTEIKHDELAA